MLSLLLMFVSENGSVDVEQRGGDASARRGLKVVEFGDDVGRQLPRNRRQEARHQPNRNKRQNLPAMTGLAGKGRRTWRRRMWRKENEEGERGRRTRKENEEGERKKEAEEK